MDWLYLLAVQGTLKSKLALIMGFPGGSVVKNLLAMQELRSPSLGWEAPLDLGHGNPLQYSCLENPTFRGAWLATVHGVEKSQT